MRGSPRQEEEIVLLFMSSVPAQRLTQSSVLWMVRVKCTGSGAERSLLLKATARMPGGRVELSYLAPLGSENISAPYFKQCV